MKRYAGPATRLLSGAPSLRRFEFPRTIFAGNSSRCIKREVEEGQDYYFSLSVPILSSVLPS